MDMKFIFKFKIFGILIFLLTPSEQSTTILSPSIITQNVPNIRQDNLVKQQNDNRIDLSQICPNIFAQTFDQSAPIGDQKSGNFTQEKDVTELIPCVEKCCLKKKDCNVAFIFEKNCYHVKCNSNKLCLPKRRSNLKRRLEMVLVNPVDNENNGFSWIDILKTENVEYFLPPGINTLDKINFWKKSHKIRLSDDGIPNYEDIANPESRLRTAIFGSRKLPLEDESDSYGTEQHFVDEGEDLPEDPSFLDTLNSKPCALISLNRVCPINEECVKIPSNTEKGVCNCIEGYHRNKHGKCIKLNLDFSAVENFLASIKQNPNIVGPFSENSENEEKLNEEVVTAKPSIKELLIKADSKVVQLPEKEVTLAAFIYPSDKSTDETYKYSWTLISQPSGAVNGTISDQSKDKVNLSNLSEGLYTFKVTVTGNQSYGEAIANVTVLPEKRINKAPEVIITPKEQTIKLPNNEAILDGSTSTDDDKIVAFHWELIQGPIGYQPKLPDTSTLQLTDLEMPGNYTFKLTITDSDNIQNSTTANITVVKTTDYPPEANAGTDIILYLPHNNVTLNGSLSTDDKEIVAWEWTKDTTEEEGKAVDMQNTRTPFLQLSNLEEGIYTFILKVTDASNQTSSAKVHVFVKPPTNLPPHAQAGTNLTINLPQTWATLNGSASTDDIKITIFKWNQKSGPNEAVIENANNSVANATSLTIGLYEFELLVTDENNNSASDSVFVTVVQEKNAAPKADAGGNQTLRLPINTIYLNGSKSSDDLKITKYLWTRDDNSLIAGKIIGTTDHEPILMLTNIVAGRYVFTLTVFDDQGLSNSQTVNIVVKQDPMILNLVELYLSIDYALLTKSEFDAIVQKIVLLIGEVKVHVRALKEDTKSGTAVLEFYVEKIHSNGKTEIVSGYEVEKILKDKFLRDDSILGIPFTDARTVICQNNCSGHGLCNTITRACQCESFWMPSIFYYWGVDEGNCDWSILYVVIGLFVGFLMLSGFFWSLLCFCRKQRQRTKKKRTRPKKQKYAPLVTQEDELPSYHRGTSLTDSETDSDVLFESNSKQNGNLRQNGANRSSSRYSKTRLGRKIKT
ncbi:dyslexia-associated protein KIAA0319-like protein isoform X2 [Condylostylus longicornis]|uniref:dyslexia-associated protein KIAA0319-like protein isoform X2 n=1 Tax=Condylostylus longicornis TaxID=2530218 RepID=UPI00244DC53B|nr:dyslexia-associated protein KIAA0319-like protein isoform X2 [Condylostylus longicornis]